MLKQIGYALLGSAALLSTHVFAAIPANGYIIEYPHHSSRQFDNSFLSVCGRCDIRMKEGVYTELQAIKNEVFTDTSIKLDDKEVATNVMISVPVHNGSSFDLKASPFASFILYNNSDYDITSDCTPYICPENVK